MVSDRLSLESLASTFMSLNSMGKKVLVGRSLYSSLRVGELHESLLVTLMGITSKNLPVPLTRYLKEQPSLSHCL